MPHPFTEIQDTIETVHPADLGCYDAAVIPEIQYLTDPRVEAGKPSYRFYAELVHKTEDRPELLADIVCLSPSKAALQRLVNKSSVGPEYCVSRFWPPVSDTQEPF